MSEFATREEFNGLGARMNGVSATVERHSEAINTSKQDRRDLWDAISKGRDEDKRIESLVTSIGKEVARMNTLFLIGNAIIVALIVKYLGG